MCEQAIVNVSINPTVSLGPYLIEASQFTDDAGRVKIGACALILCIQATVTLLEAENCWWTWSIHTFQDCIKMVNPMDCRGFQIGCWWVSTGKKNHLVPILVRRKPLMDAPSIPFCGRQVPADGFRFWVLRLVRWVVLSKIDLGDYREEI